MTGQGRNFPASGGTGAPSLQAGPNICERLALQPIGDQNGTLTECLGSKVEQTGAQKGVYNVSGIHVHDHIQQSLCII